MFPLDRIKFLYLKILIHFLRSRMIKTGKSKGLSHPKTIMYSQYLDMVLNKYTHHKI